MADPEDQHDGRRRPERRKNHRRPVLKRARLIFSKCTFECLLLDISDAGARVRMTAPTQVPEWVRLDIADGASFLANRRWIRGLEIGFSLTPPENADLLNALIDGLTRDQKRHLMAKINASLAREENADIILNVLV